LHGISARAGRKEMEIKMDGIVASLKENQCLISLDYSGWSPNAPREWHMKFHDMLYSFFKTDVKAS
jgi:hypothetical protein